MEKNLELQQLRETKAEETVQQNSEAVRTSDKAAYMKRINALSAEDQAFMDGFLFAKVTAAGKRGA